MTAAGTSPSRSVAGRVDAFDWDGLGADLAESGHAQTPQLLDPDECAELSSLYEQTERFRSTIDMARHRFGSGTYRYFAYPLPEMVTALREAFYARLVPIARTWAARLGRPAPWPDTLDEWLAACHRAGQRRPTPILLRYQAGDWNALHRDLYGELVFPLQVVVGLDRPGIDYSGGEFLMVEQRPRAQSRSYSTTLAQGHTIIFATADRPVRCSRGWSAAPMRHGVSTLRAGTRHTLGLVLHDAT